MKDEQVKILIHGIPPAWISYEIEGTEEDIVNTLYSAMRDKHEIYIYMQEACNAYELYLSDQN